MDPRRIMEEEKSRNYIRLTVDPATKGNMRFTLHPLYAGPITLDIYVASPSQPSTTPSASEESVYVPIRDLLPDSLVLSETEPESSDVEVGPTITDVIKRNNRAPNKSTTKPHPMLLGTTDFNHSTSHSTCDPMQRSGFNPAFNWTLPVDGSNQHLRSISEAPSSSTTSPFDPSLRHVARDDVLNVIRQASEHDLTMTGNAAYMRLQLSLAHITNEKTQADALKRSLEDEIIRLQTRMQTIEEINNKLSSAPAMQFPQATGSSNQSWTHLPPTKDPPAPLSRNDFDGVKFWSKSIWNTHERAQKGATDGNSRKARKRGRPEKENPDDDGDSLEPNTTHVYLETEEGIPVSKELVTRQGQRIRCLWATLSKHGLAPMVWSDADSHAVRFIESTMLNDPRFHYLRLCDDNWKLRYWISKNYPSWVRNHLVLDGATKAKKDSPDLDNENLLRITPDPSNDELRMTLEPSNATSHNESCDMPEVIPTDPPSPSPRITPLDIVDPLRDEDEDESPPDDPMGTPMLCPEVTPAEPHIPEPEMHIDGEMAPATTGAREDGEVALATLVATTPSTSAPLPREDGEVALATLVATTPSTSAPLPREDGEVALATPVATTPSTSAPLPREAREDGEVALATPVATTPSTSAPLPDTSLVGGPTQSPDKPAPKKRKTSGPAIVSDSISDKNLCRQDWLKSHQDGTEDEYKTYWLSLPEQEIKRWKQAAALQRKARNEKKKKKGGYRAMSSSFTHTFLAA
ncbi:hypothetical protein BC826DRAFT_1110770 [Russula brevipes]|nr:hypothetical protein BC826DRAFT_1110770 [Russula brevipes]